MLDLLLRKHPWILDLVVAGLCGAMLAHAAAQAFVEEPAVVTRPTRRSPPAPSLERGPIDRNVFCSSCQAKPAPVADPRPRRTTLPLVIVAIMYAPPPLGRDWSAAVVRDREAHTLQIVGTGDSLHGATVLDIGATRLSLRREAVLEFLDLLDEPLESAPASPPEASGIRKVGERSYEIRRSALQELLGNMNLLARAARIVPEVREGHGAGFRLYQVQPDGPFARIGLRNGDLVSSINGLELASVEQAMEVYAKLKSAAHISVGLVRDGHRLTTEYRIQ
jgi:general secretion pathway protein C